MNLRIINLDRQHSIAHVALDTTHDRGVVVDEDARCTHSLTGESMPVTVFRGTIPECVKYVDSLLPEGGAQ